jgi:hypothetical protein
MAYNDDMSQIDPVTRPPQILRAVCLLPTVRTACFTACVVLAALIGLFSALRARAAVPHLGYGFNVAEWDYDRIQNMGFNWIKVFEVPQTPLPLHVLVRIDATAALSNDLLAFNADLDAKLVFTGNVDAWEIGNEPNLDADFGWGAAPDPIAYKNLLCAAYAKIKQADPDAIVVSAGLAPVGRVITVPGNPDGSNGQYQDERKYLEQLLIAGGGDCLDVVGLHPYGFSADYNVEPDVVSADSTQNCDQGLCFRTAEKFYEVMQANGLGDKKMWATEFGWLVTPPDDCLDDPSFQDRTWQLVSADKQASNLASALQYADANWPWMGAMFIFNLNFNTAPWLANPCDQMKYYSLQTQAEAALTNIPKNVADIPARLKSSKTIDVMIAQADQPITTVLNFGISNSGWQPLVYTTTVNTTTDVVPDLIGASGVLSPTAAAVIQLSIASLSRSVGLYTGSMTIAAAPGTLSTPRNVSINLVVVEHVYQTYLPLISFNNAP